MALCTLRVGQASPELLDAHKRQRTKCSAFLTAHNPFSELLDEGTNAARQADLARELTRKFHQKESAHTFKPA